MAEMYSLEVAANLLGISEKTLKSRMNRLGIEGEKDPLDRRRLLLTLGDLERLRARSANVDELRKQVNVLESLAAATKQELDKLESDGSLDASSQARAVNGLRESVDALGKAVLQQLEKQNQILRRLDSIEQVEIRQMQESLEDIRQVVNKGLEDVRQTVKKNMEAPVRR